METDTTIKTVKTAFEDINDNLYELHSISKALRRNSILLTTLACELATIHTDSDYTTLENRLPEIEKINSKIRILAEARAYMSEFEKIVEGDECR